MIYFLCLADFDRIRRCSNVEIDYKNLNLWHDFCCGLKLHEIFKNCLHLLGEGQNRLFLIISNGSKNRATNVEKIYQ